MQVWFWWGRRFRLPGPSLHPVLPAVPQRLQVTQAAQFALTALPLQPFAAQPCFQSRFLFAVEASAVRPGRRRRRGRAVAVIVVLVLIVIVDIPVPVDIR